MSSNHVINTKCIKNMFPLLVSFSFPQEAKRPQEAKKPTPPAVDHFAAKRHPAS